MNPNAEFSEQAKPIVCLLGTVPSTSTPLPVSLKGYLRATFLVLVKNATTVTGSAITLKQSTSIALAGEKAVAFTKALRNIDLAADPGGIAEFAVSNNTFTTDATNSKNLLYVLEVHPGMLDADGGFDVVRVGTGDATAATVTVLAILWPAKEGGKAEDLVDPAVD